MLRRCIRLLSPWAVVVCATHALAQHQPAVQPEQPPLTFDQPAAPLPGSAAAEGVSPNYGQPAAGAPAYGAQAAPPAYGQPAQGAAAAPAQPMAPAATTPAAIDPAAAAAAAAPAPPFVLQAAEAQFVYQVLKLWETSSSKINTFNADFTRFEYDEVWHADPKTPMIVSEGVLSYSKPDKGSFKIDVIKRFTKTDPADARPDAPGSYVEQKDEVGEHWVCDGKAIYQYDHRVKELKVTAIPEDMRGASIVEGPLPFLFGAEADKLVERYWIRATDGPTEIWLEAYPRRQSDAANYEHVDVLLDRTTMQPLAIQVHLPGGKQRHAYKFGEPTINGKMEAWFGALFSAPRTPIGWKKVVMTGTELPPGTPSPQATNPGEALQR